MNTMPRKPGENAPFKTGTMSPNPAQAQYTLYHRITMLLAQSCM